MDDLISRQAAIDALNEIINKFEQILRDIRESKVDDSVCGLCEYDGAYIGQSGNWCNECPGVYKDDCFKLSDEYRKRWLESVDLSSVDVEPVKHGRWEFEAKWQYKNCDGRGMERKEIFGTTKRTCNRLKCSKCKKAVVIDDTIAYAYCPHCGAKMDAEEGEAHETD